MQKQLLPIYQIQDFNAQAQKERYFHQSSLANHLQEHLFIREPHKHSFYIILFITQGTGTHTIDFKEYEVRPDMFFFLTPGQVHSWELSNDADGFVSFFTPEFYLSRFPHRRLSDFPFFSAQLHQPLLFVSEQEKLALMPTIQALQGEYQGEQLMRNEMLSCYLDILLIHLTRLFQQHGAALEAHDRELQLLEELENLVEHHYKEHAPVTFYAARLNITAKQLNQVCKITLGKTTSELIQERLMLEAQRLLVYSELTSSQTAAELGFADINYFFRFFKKHTGATPEGFRAKSKRKL